VPKIKVCFLRLYNEQGFRFDRELKDFIYRYPDYGCTKRLSEVNKAQTM